MPELDDAMLERRLRGVLQEHLGALPLDLTVDALDRRREAKRVARRSGRGRGLTLLAAAALLVGGALAAGSGILRLPSVVPPVPPHRSLRSPPHRPMRRPRARAARRHLPQHHPQVRSRSIARFRRKARASRPAHSPGPRRISRETGPRRSAPSPLETGRSNRFP